MLRGSEPAAAPADERRATPTAATPEATSLGMNLSPVNDWNREWVFVDVFRQSRAWISQNSGGEGPWDNGLTVLVDEAGWPQLKPGQAATTLMCRDLDGHYPAGAYVCTFDGDGQIEFGFDARAVERSPGRIVVDVTPTSAGMLLRIDHSDPQNPIRNIHVTMPGFDRAASAFHPLFVERLKPFKVLRFMDWAATNNSKQQHWSDRTTPQRSTQAGSSGVAIEYMIDLCNELGCDAWFCIPHQADDDYVRHFAELVHARLNDRSCVHIEWSNEAWNGIFEQNAWVQSEARIRSIGWTWVIADEARRDWEIWREVFHDRPDRVVRVVAGQHYNPWVCQDIADRLAGEFDALACGAYFFAQPSDLAAFNGSTTPEQVLRSCMANLDGPGLDNWKQHSQLAASWSAKLGRRVGLLAYEGGQHLTTEGKASPLTNVYAAAQTHPDMQRAYGQLLAALEATKFDTFVAFNYVGQQNAYGNWGHLQYQDEPLEQSPKFRALTGSAADVPSP
jgi:hypothetical protein